MSETRARILRVTRDLYLSEGAAAVSTRRVAERVGVTATALYRHFPGKDALVEEVVSEAYRVFAGYLEQSLEGRTPGERLKRSGGAYLRFALEQPEMYRTIFMTGAPGSGGDHRRRATFSFLVDRVRECVEGGELRPGDPEEIAVTIWAHVHGLVSLHIAGALGGGEEAFRGLYSASLGRLFRGLLP